MSQYEIEEAIAEQIAHEQSLTASRMNWNLTFQGFMMAAFALVATAEVAEPARHLLEITICVAGFLVSLATLYGVLASQIQRTALRKHWTDSFPNGSAYPKPFSEAKASLMGRRPAPVICWTMMAMWLVLLLLVVASIFEWLG